MNKIDHDKMVADYHAEQEAKKGQTIGMQIEDFREHTLGVSQVKLAEMIGVNRSQISRWESDETLPSLKSVSKLVTIGMDADTLILDAWRGW